MLLLNCFYLLLSFANDIDSAKIMTKKCHVEVSNVIVHHIIDQDCASVTIVIGLISGHDIFNILGRTMKRFMRHCRLDHNKLSRYKCKDVDDGDNKQPLCIIKIYGELKVNLNWESLLCEFIPKETNSARCLIVSLLGSI